MLSYIPDRHWFQSFCVQCKKIYLQRRVIYHGENYVCIYFCQSHINVACTVSLDWFEKSTLHYHATITLAWQKYKGMWCFTVSASRFSYGIRAACQVEQKHILKSLWKIGTNKYTYFIVNAENVPDSRPVRDLCACQSTSIYRLISYHLTTVKFLIKA